MNWGSAAAFFDMGGHGLYVWGAYGVAVVLMAVEPWLAVRRRRRAARRATEAPDEDRQR